MHRLPLETFTQHIDRVRANRPKAKKVKAPEPEKEEVTEPESTEPVVAVEEVVDTPKRKPRAPRKSTTTKKDK